MEIAMNSDKSKITKGGLLAGLVLLLIFSGAALAAPLPYIIDWFTVDGGGGTSSGGTFALSGTIGQPEAGTLSSGGDFELVGGFWTGGGQPPPEYRLYLPALSR
jgi:hypothetical protein